MNTTTPTEHKGSHRASPWAVLGAFGLVAVAVFFGVFGPQISNRGNLILGSTLDELLTGSVMLYERESMELRYARNATFMPIESGVIELELLRLFNDQAGLLDFTAAGFEPVQYDSGVRLDDFGNGPDACAVVYADMESSAPASTTVLLLYVADGRLRVAHDRFGIPMMMVPGEIYRSPVIASPSGEEIWTAAWYEGPVLHVLLAGSSELLDLLLKAGGQDDDVPLSDPDLARLMPDFRLVPPPQQGRLS